MIVVKSETGEDTCLCECTGCGESFIESYYLEYEFCPRCGEPIDEHMTDDEYKQMLKDRDDYEAQVISDYEDAKRPAGGW